MYLILQSILLLTPPVVGQRSVAISMPACPRAHLTNSMSNLHQSFFSHLWLWLGPPVDAL